MTAMTMTYAPAVSDPPPGGSVSPAQTATTREVGPDPPPRGRRGRKRTRSASSPPSGAATARCHERRVIRRVTFDPSPPSCAPDRKAGPVMTESEIRDRWVSDEEHAANVEEARNGIRKLMAMRMLGTSSAGGTADDHDNGAIAEEEGDSRWYRGLEARASPDRSHRRKVVIGAVLKVQERLRAGQPGGGPTTAAAEGAAEALAHIAERLSLPAAELAGEVGVEDREDALRWGGTADGGDPRRPGGGGVLGKRTREHGGEENDEEEVERQRGKRDVRSERTRSWSKLARVNP